MQYHTMPCITMPYHAIPYEVLYRAIPYRTIQYHIIPPCSLGSSFSRTVLYQVWGKLAGSKYHICHTIFYTIPNRTMQYHTILHHTTYHIIPSCQLGSSTSSSMRCDGRPKILYTTSYPYHAISYHIYTTLLTWKLRASSTSMRCAGRVKTPYHTIPYHIPYHTTP